MTASYTDFMLVEAALLRREDARQLQK